MNTLWPNLPTRIQDRMIAAYMDFAGDAGCDRPQAMHDLSTMDVDTLREHLTNGIGYSIEDEHDRAVDIRYDGFTRDYEHANDASFQDLAHALVLAQDCIQDRIERLEALKSPDVQMNRNRDAMVARLKMSHSRLAEVLLQQDEELFSDGDGWLTRAADVWIRG